MESSKNDQELSQNNNNFLRCNKFQQMKWESINCYLYFFVATYISIFFLYVSSNFLSCSLEEHVFYSLHDTSVSVNFVANNISHL